MKHESIFEYLKREKSVNNLIRKSGGTPGSEDYVSRKIRREMGANRVIPRKQITERIMKEFDERRGTLSNSERGIALKHLTKVYSLIQMRAVNSYEKACNLQNPESSMYDSYLNSAWELTRESKRALQPVNIVRQGKEYLFRQERWEVLLNSFKGFRRLLCFASESPEKHRELKELDGFLADAINQEDYESAAHIKKEMDDMLSIGRIYPINIREL